MTTFFGAQVVRTATTLREAVFARLIVSVAHDGGATAELAFKQIGDWICPIIVLPCPPLLSVDDLPLAVMLAEVEKERAGYFARIPFAWHSAPNRDLELIEPLQDLAHIIAAEAQAAFKADYYPGVPDVDAIPDEHVTAVMVAMQREMDREGKTRNKVPTQYTSLPFERQRALAERRRYWYGKFGITPQSWGSGVFSLWDVADEPFPELIGGKPV